MGEERREARDEGCAFRIFEGYVAEPYEVLGRIQLDAFGAGGLPVTVDELREEVGEDVCEAGGDGFFAIQNAPGRYAAGLVVHFLPPVEEAPCAPEVEPEDAEAQDAGPQDAGPQDAGPQDAGPQGAAPEDAEAEDGPAEDTEATVETADD